jgi:hypothetical protein
VLKTSPVLAAILISDPHEKMKLLRQTIQWLFMYDVFKSSEITRTEISEAFNEWAYRGCCTRLVAMFIPEMIYLLYMNATWIMFERGWCGDLKMHPVSCRTSKIVVYFIICSVLFYVAIVLSVLSFSTWPLYYLFCPFPRAHCIICSVLFHRKLKIDQAHTQLKLTSLSCYKNHMIF